MCRVIATFVHESPNVCLEVRTSPSPFPVPETRRFRPARPVPLPCFLVRFVRRFLLAERVVQRHLLRGLIGQAGHLFLHLRAQGREQVIRIEALGSGAGAPRWRRRVPGRVGREPATARVPSGTEIRRRHQQLRGRSVPKRDAGDRRGRRAPPSCAECVTVTRAREGGAESARDACHGARKCDRGRWSLFP